MVLRVAVTVPLRLVRCNSAISPKNVPFDSRTRWLGSSISTSPAVMKYIDEAGSPRRTSTSRASMVCARNSRMMSTISEAPRCENSGTRASMAQVTMKSRRRTSSVNARETIATGNAIIAKPTTMANTDTILPSGVTGTTSP